MVRPEALHWNSSHYEEHLPKIFNLPSQGVVDLTGHIDCGEFLCSGAFGQVYKGIWRNLNGSGSLPLEQYALPNVAVKVISIPSLTDAKKKEKRFKRMKRELELWRQVNHRNILPLVGIARIDGDNNRPALISPWMEYGNVTEFLKQHPTFPAVSLLHDIIEAIHFLHAFEPEIIHGDIKAANVLVNYRNEAYLCDFGLSRFAVDNTLWRTTATQASGTLRWMAPELMEGETATSTKASDIYAYAMTCYEILSGKTPFSTLRSDASVIRNVLGGNRPERIALFHPDGLWSVITQCWAQNAEERPSTGEVLRLVLQFIESSDNLKKQIASIGKDIKAMALLPGKPITELPPPPSLVMSEDGKEEGDNVMVAERWEVQNSKKKEENEQDYNVYLGPKMPQFVWQTSAPSVLRPPKLTPSALELFLTDRNQKQQASSTRKLNVAQAAKEAGQDYANLSQEEQEAYKLQSHALREVIGCETSAYTHSLTPANVRRENAPREKKPTFNFIVSSELGDPYSPLSQASKEFNKEIASEPTNEVKHEGTDSQRTNSTPVPKSTISESAWKSMPPKPETSRLPAVADAKTPDKPSRKSSPWIRAHLPGPAKEYSARAPDPESLKALWSQTSNDKAGLQPLNSMEGIPDDLTALLLTIQEMKSEDLETPSPPSGPSSTRTFLHDVTSMDFQPSYRLLLPNNMPPTYAAHPPPEMSRSPSTLTQPNGYASMYNPPPMWMPVQPPAQNSNGMMRPMTSPYGSTMISYPVNKPPPTMYPATTIPNNMSGASPMQHAPAAMYTGSPAMMYMQMIPTTGYTSLPDDRGQHRPENEQMGLHQPNPTQPLISHAGSSPVPPYPFMHN